MKIWYCSRKRDEKYSTKGRGYISPRDMINIRDFITVMGFTVIIQIRGISSWDINTLWPNFQLINVFASLIYFNLPVEIIFVIFSYFSIYLSLFQSLCLIWLKFWFFLNCLNTCDDRPVRQIICTDHLQAYDRLLDMDMIWCKNKNTSPFMPKNNYI